MAGKKTGTAKTGGRAKATRTVARKSASKVRKSAAGRLAMAQPSLKHAGNGKQNTMEKNMTQGKVQFDRLAQDGVKGGKDQVEAVMKSGNVFMKGFEDIVKTCVTLAQTSAEKNAQAVKSMMSCKTVTEFTETQNKWVQQNFDDFMSGATRLSELSVKLTTEALEPINDQVGKTIRKATESMAA